MEHAEVRPARPSARLAFECTKCLWYGCSGWTVIDNAIVLNGTLFIVTKDKTQFEDVSKMFSSGVEMSNEPSTWPGREPSSRHIQIVTPDEALVSFGDHGKYASIVEGTTFWCNDDRQCLCSENQHLS